MRPAISTLAWPAEPDDAALAAIAARGFEGVELLPVRALGPLAEATPPALAALRGRIEGAGLRVAALQAVLFGVAGIHLFASPEARAALARALADVARVAGALGAAASVFGAPGLRDPGGLDPRAAFDIAAAFLRGVGPAFADRGTVLCFEPVGPGLGGTFMRDTGEALALVRAADHPGVRLQIDTGNLLTEGAGALAQALPFAGHVHVSEPALAPVGAGASDHAALGGALARAGWRGWVSVEMKPAGEAAVDAARAVLARNYRATAPSEA